MHTHICTYIHTHMHTHTHTHTYTHTEPRTERPRTVTLVADRYSETCLPYESSGMSNVGARYEDKVVVQVNLR